VRPVSGTHRVRTRCGSWTSPSSRQRWAGRGGWPGCRDYWSKYELGRHVSPTANQHDAISAVELALAEAEQLAGTRLVDLAPRDADGSVLPLITIVTDNGGPFRSFRFEAFIAIHPELRHVRTRVRTPGQNGSRERGFGTLKYERLFLEEIDVLDMTVHAERYRVDYIGSACTRSIAASTIASRSARGDAAPPTGGDSGHDRVAGGPRRRPRRRAAPRPESHRRRTRWRRGAAGRSAPGAGSIIDARGVPASPEVLDQAAQEIADSVEAASNAAPNWAPMNTRATAASSMRPRDTRIGAPAPRSDAGRPEPLRPTERTHNPRHRHAVGRTPR
jgi:hypothetical protein